MWEKAEDFSPVFIIDVRRFPSKKINSCAEHDVDGWLLSGDGGYQPSHRARNEGELTGVALCPISEPFDKLYFLINDNAKQHCQQTIKRGFAVGTMYFPIGFIVVVVCAKYHKSNYLLTLWSDFRSFRFP